MSGQVQNTVRAAVMPDNLSRTFVHTREYPVIDNGWRNGLFIGAPGVLRCRSFRGSAPNQDGGQHTQSVLAEIAGEVTRHSGKISAHHEAEV